MKTKSKVITEGFFYVAIPRTVDDVTGYHKPRCRWSACVYLNSNIKKYPLNWRLPNKSEIIIEFLIIQEQNNNKYNTNGPQFDISSWRRNDTHTFVWDTTPLMLWHNYWASSTTSCTLVGIALQREWLLRHNVRLRVIEVTQMWTFSPWNNIVLSYLMEHFTITYKLSKSITYSRKEMHPCKYHRPFTPVFWKTHNNRQERR